MTDITGLLPHAGTARMIERVVSWDGEHIVAATARHRATDNPLRKDGRLAAVHLAEFGAQTMAIHGGLLNRAAGNAPKPALLVSVRDFACTRDFIEELPGELRVTARVLLATPANFQYAFEVHSADERIAGGRVAAMLYDLPGGMGSQAPSGN
jgi:predicted hotdog family 3-hydroxylacyl-ACP dehydratase